VSLSPTAVCFRKLADLGYKRSAKKCKEKFENVHKYYKRTKDGRAGRQDGKSYRFFSELEALHAANAGATPQQPPASSAPQLHAFAAPPVVSAPAPMNSLPPVSTGPMQPAPISSAAPVPAPLELRPHQPLNLQGLSFSSMSSDSDESDGESDDGDDMTAETDQDQQLGSKRKRGGRKKMMSFFEGLLQKVVERQEEMQRRFLDTMEKREAERTAREEAWRRQEVARINREQDQLAQERVAGASRDAAIIAFLQRIGGGTSVVQPPAVVPLVPMPAAQVHVHHTPPPKQPTPQPPQATPPQPKPISASPLQQQPPQQQYKEASPQHAGTTPRDAPPTTPGPGASLDLAPPPASEQHHVVDSVFGGGGEGGGVSSSRWPKAEVHALIQLRMDMYNCYQENGPKAPMWEEISAGMRRLGYSRSSKRCKEKWENINKYYKKVKESNKRRPEDSKTCPYFHQLEAIYRKKQQRQDGGAPAANVAAAPAFAPDQMNQSGRHEIEGKNTNDDKRNNGGPSGGGAPVVPASNRETSPPAANKVTIDTVFVSSSSLRRFFCRARGTIDSES
jgi:hypothetical protein